MQITVGKFFIWAPFTTDVAFATTQLEFMKFPHNISENAGSEWQVEK